VLGPAVVPLVLHGGCEGADVAAEGAEVEHHRDEAEEHDGGEHQHQPHHAGTVRAFMAIPSNHATRRLRPPR